jgi:hypothetical protein
MQSLSHDELLATSGGKLTLTVVADVPSEVASFLTQIAASVASGTIKTTKDLQYWISSFETRGGNFGLIQIDSITFSEIVL